MSEPRIDLLADRELDGSRPRPEPAGTRAETQLRARVGELQARLAVVDRCLEDAECRAAELLVSRARLESLRGELIAERDAVRDLRVVEHKLGVIEASRSWRLTTPLRRGMHRARGWLGR